MRILTIFCAVLLACVLAIAHDEVRDPVCGMMVDPETAPAHAEFEGRTYWFCQEREKGEFLADPARYISLVRVQRWFGAGLFSVTADPATPSAGSEVRILASLAPRAGGTVDHSKPVKLASAELRLWRIARDREPRELRVQMSDMGGRSRGALAWVDEPGEWRGLVEAETRTGERLRATLSFTVGPQKPPPPRAEGEFTMAVQHEVMKRMGRDWQEIELQLARKKPDGVAVAAAAARIEGDRELLPNFSLHVNADAKAEFDVLAGRMAGPLAEFRAAVAAQSWEEARAGWRRIDARNCTLCHLKFRWDAVRDLSRFSEAGRAR